MMNKLLLALLMIGVASAAGSDAALKKMLLAPHMDTLGRVVFTKHFDMGGSHYAYTDAVSNEDTLNPKGQVKEFNFVFGSSLCVVEIDKDFAHSRQLSA